MQGDSEPTTLSEGERRILASIEAELDLRDPGFAARYRRRLDPGRGRLTLFAAAAIVAGGVLMVATFTTSLLLASAGAALMGIGGAAGAPRVEVAARRLGGFLGWWVDPSGGGRRPGLRDDAP
jgi:Flp pilus assembly protein TadB